MVVHVLSEMFSWPNGIVVGNLMASAILGVPAVLHLDRRAKRRHEKVMEKVNGPKVGE